MADQDPASELLKDPAHLRSDCRLAIRALREGWITPDDAKIRTYLKLKTADLIRVAASEKKVNVRKYRALVKLFAELEYLALNVMKAESVALSLSADAVGSDSPVKRVLVPPLYPARKAPGGKPND